MLTETSLSVSITYLNPLYYGLGTIDSNITSAYVGSRGHKTANVTFADDTVPVINFPNPEDAVIKLTIAVNPAKDQNGFLPVLYVTSHVNVPLLGGVMNMPVEVYQQVTGF